MSGDSSSSEDEYEKIKEAVDQSFLTETLYTNDTSKHESESLSKPKSLRNQNHQEVSNNPFSIKVTPEFQKHVSKHLTRILDEIIDDNDTILKTKKVKKHHSNYGIKLLCSSRDYLLCSTNTEETTKPKRFSIKNKDTSDYESKAKEVAVSPEWVLSQEETKYWAPSTKGVIEIVKIDEFSNNFNCLKKKKKKKIV